MRQVAHKSAEFIEYTQSIRTVEARRNCVHLIAARLRCHQLDLDWSTRGGLATNDVAQRGKIILRADDLFNLHTLTVLLTQFCFYFDTIGHK